MNYGSLFTGIGGLDLAVESAWPGIVPAWQCEIDPYCRRVLERWWPDVERFEDVRTIQPPAVDLVCGGFPCQDVSSAGKRAGIDGPRSGLWREFVRVIRDVRPSLVVVENVTSGLYAWLPTVLADLASLGFDAEWETVRAADVGAPHERRRTFVLGHSHPHRESALAIDGQTPLVPLPPSAVRSRWDAPPARLRMADGVPSGLDRLRALGNAACPQQAVLALNRMIHR